MKRQRTGDKCNTVVLSLTTRCSLLSFRRLVVVCVTVLLQVLLIANNVIVIDSYLSTATTRTTTNHKIFQLFQTTDNNNHNELIFGCRRRPKKFANAGSFLFSTINSNNNFERISSQGTKQSDNNNKNNKDNKNEVIYQKIVRKPPNLKDDVLFLGHLIEYIQEKFEFPDRLPMVYEKKQSSSDNSSDGQNTPIVCWDSPLSPIRDATCMYVQVIGIVTSNNDEVDAEESRTTSSAVPSMAMVAVEKRKTTGAFVVPSKLPPMLESLFQDSERKIIKHLDRGLDEFMSGKIKFDTNNHDTVSSKQNQRDQRNKDGCDAIVAEIMENDDDENNNDPQPTKRNVENTMKKSSSSLVDADIIQKNGIDTTTSIQTAYVTNNNDKQKQVEQQRRREAVLKTMQPMGVATPTTTSSTTTMTAAKNQTQYEPIGLEYAVQAAKQAAAAVAAKRKKLQDYQQQNVVGEDYAIQAAKVSIAAKRKKETKKKQTVQSVSDLNGNRDNDRKRTTTTTVSDSSKSVYVSSTENDVRRINPDNIMSSLSSIRSPMLDPKLYGNGSNNRKKFMTTISKPSDFQKKQMTVSSTKQQQSGLSSSELASGNVVSKAESDYKPLLQNNVDLPKGIATNDLEAIRGGEQSSSSSTTLNDTPSVSTRDIPSDEMLMQAAQDALSEMEEAGVEMTPEEILADIMKFGDQQQDDTPLSSGNGFANGAFEKAKDILRERQRIVSDVIQNPMNAEPYELKRQQERTRNDNGKMYKELTAEEELRKMFEAGERIAESRIDLSSKSVDQGTSDLQSSKRKTPDDYTIDSLIDSDKTISKYARVLDDELVELQVRINKSPDEMLDGPTKNPLFDLLSGPEVYDRNVDPETAVNWPGALPGTRNIRFPKELDVAVKQAKFAAEVLMSVKQERSTETGAAVYKVGNRVLSPQQITNFRSVVEQAVEIGLIDNPFNVIAETGRLQMLLDELWDQPDERFRDITSNYKDLLLSDHFVTLIKVRLQEMADRDLDALRRDDTTLEIAHARERELLGQIVEYAQLLLKEARALGAELEVQQLEIIRSICKVAMDPRHQTEEEASIALTNAVQDMRPLFDDAFVAYLKFSVAEEEGKLARAGLLQDPEYNQWLNVLKIVQQGVYAEIAKGINRYIEHIWYVLRMEASIERRRLLEELINVMPTMDVRPFVQVVENIVASLGDGVRGDFDGITPLGEMTNKLLQLQRDVKDLLPPERITEKSRDADEWAAKQKKRLLDQRNLTKQRLKAAQDTEHLDEQIESFGKRGEVDRFD